MIFIVYQPWPRDARSIFAIGGRDLPRFVRGALRAHADEFDRVLDIDVAVLLADGVGPVLDELRLERDAVAAAPAEQVMAVLRTGPQPVQLAAARIPDRVNLSGTRQLVQHAVDGVQPDALA